jgi:hypothetical protein
MLHVVAVWSGKQGVLGVTDAAFSAGGWPWRTIQNFRQLPTLQVACVLRVMIVQMLHYLRSTINIH